MVWTWDIDGSGVPETPLVISEDPPVIVVDEVPEPMPSVEAASLLLPPVVPAPAPSAHELACAAAPDLAPSDLETAPLRSEFHSDAAQSLTPLVGPGPVAGKQTLSLGARELAAPADPTPSAPAVEPTLVAPLSLLCQPSPSRRRSSLWQGLQSMIYQLSQQQLSPRHRHPQMSQRWLHPSLRCQPRPYRRRPSLCQGLQNLIYQLSQQQQG